MTDETATDEQDPGARALPEEDVRQDDVAGMDPDAPARSLFDEDADAVEPNEPA